MTLKLKVHHGQLTLPDNLHIPDGVELDVSVPGEYDSQSPRVEVCFPIYQGGGPFPGIDLNDTSSLWPILDGDKYPRLA